MSDNTAFAILALCLTLVITTCSVGGDWRRVEFEKIQFEREKLEKVKQ